MPDVNTTSIVSDYEAGTSMREIANAHHISRQTVRRVLIDAGVYANTTTVYAQRRLDEGADLDAIAAELSKRERPNGHWLRVRQLFGDRQFKTGSDVGGVKIGNSSFSVIVPNGRGDRVSRVAVFERGELPDGHLFDMMHYWSTVSGECDIYASDVGNAVVATISGRFAIYYFDSFVAFEKMGD